MSLTDPLRPPIPLPRRSFTCSINAFRTRGRVALDPAPPECGTVALMESSPGQDQQDRYRASLEQKRQTYQTCLNVHDLPEFFIIGHTAIFSLLPFGFGSPNHGSGISGRATGWRGQPAFRTTR